MTDNKSQALAYAKANQERFLNELVELVKIPSVSTDPERKADMLSAAKWVADKLSQIGMENIDVMDTGGHPVVYADWKSVV